MYQFLGDIGFRPLKSGPCVHNCEGDVSFVILMLYLDDLLCWVLTSCYSTTSRRRWWIGSIWRIWVTCREFSAWTSPVIAKRGWPRLIKGAIRRTWSKLRAATPRIRLVWDRSYPRTTGSRIAGQGGQEVIPIHHGCCHVPTLGSVDVSNFVHRYACHWLH